MNLARARKASEPALGKVWGFIRSQPGLWSDGHNIFLYHHPTQPGAPILCDFGVEGHAHICSCGRGVRDRNVSGEAAAALSCWHGDYDRAPFEVAVERAKARNRIQHQVLFGGSGSSGSIPSRCSPRLMITGLHSSSN